MSYDVTRGTHLEKINLGKNIEEIQTRRLKWLSMTTPVSDTSVVWAAALH